MKKVILLVVLVTLAAVNVNLAFNSNESVIDLSLTSIMALAAGESGSGTCSLCGNNVLNCNCDDYGITCDHGSCDGKVCHTNSYNWSCRCRANGNPLSFCA